MAATTPTKRVPAKKAAAGKKSAVSQLLPGLVPDGPAADEADTAAAAAVEEFTGFDLDGLDKKSVLPDVTDVMFEFLLDGHVYRMKDPRDVDWKRVLDGISNPILFMRLALVDDGDEGAEQPEDEPSEADRFIGTELPGWKLSALFDRWQEHYGVDGLTDLNRLFAGRSGPRTAEQ